MQEKNFIESVKSILPTFKETDAAKPFRDAGIDSIDLVAIRVDFERLIGTVIPDSDWLEFETISEVFEYCSTKKTVEQNLTAEFQSSNLDYNVIINMPQMALGALSENWLFKEIGGTHWNLICNGLGKSSFDLRDDLNNRLYATFVRIRIDFSGNLKSFKESEKLQIGGEIKRFGESMYFSALALKSNNEIINADLMTTFSIRNSTDNTKLAKSQPFGTYNKIQSFAELPTFGNDYRLLKKGELDALKYKDLEFKISDKCIFEIEYNLNPYYDLNGVNLLYFAAYPIINDNCEAKYFNDNMEIIGRWEQTYYTTFKDVFYFSNCNIDEVIIYRLLNKKELEDGSIQIQSELLRKSDMNVMAKIFTIKSKFK